MGNSSTCPVREVLRELLEAKGFTITNRVLDTFLQEVDAVAPWFAVSGSLTVPCWDKLGKDLDFAWEQGSLKGGVRGMWEIIRECLEDADCRAALRATEEVLEEVKERRSEGSKKGDKGKARGKESISPSLEDLESSSESEEEDLEMLEEDLGALLKRIESLALEKRKKRGRSKKQEAEKRPEPSCPPCSDMVVCRPPPYAEVLPSGGKGGSTFCPQTWRQAILEMPVMENANHERYHEPLDFKQLKNLAESVKAYGINASFTQALIDRLGRTAMTPQDWMDTVKACLTMGQYLDWKSIYTDLAQQQARTNANNGQPAWSLDMLLGQGQWVNNQTAFPLEVYAQINTMAIKAWKALPNKGEVSGNLTRILQGPTEPFSDFVARMMEAAGRIFGDPETAMPLIEQLVFEQCTRECRNAITPWKGKGLQAWMKACRELGGPLSNAGLAAAVMQLSKGKGSTPAGVCFHCGHQGHLKRQCPERGTRGSSGNGQCPKQPGLCPKCRKGNHWANECRSVKDIDGQPIGAVAGGARPKNAMRGPRPQGPRIYGAVEEQSRPQVRLGPNPSGEPLQVPRDWTSTAPPGL